MASMTNMAAIIVVATETCQGVNTGSIVGHVAHKGARIEGSMKHVSCGAGQDLLWADFYGLYYVRRLYRQRVAVRGRKRHLHGHDTFALCQWTVWVSDATVVMYSMLALQDSLPQISYDEVRGSQHGVLRWVSYLLILFSSLCTSPHTRSFFT